MPPSRPSPAVFLIPCWLLFHPSIQAENPASSSDRPNILFLMADDLGWSDLGVTGSPWHRTPVLDRLAREGLRFTDAYSNGPNCAPTRACLMSGQYPPRHGIYTVASGARGQARHRKLVPVENETVLAPRFVTLAETLRAAGYQTAHFGKWHLGHPGETGPLEQGFELNVAGNHRGHPPSYFSPYRNAQLADGPDGEYLTDRLTREALAFLDRRESDRPFFLYFPFYTVHTPIQGKPEKVEKYRELLAGKKPAHPGYAAMVESLDENVGRLLAKIDELGLRESTLVIFTSDNGGLGGYEGLGTREYTSNAPLRGGKGMLHEGGIRVPLIVRWPGQVPAGKVSSTPVITLDFYPTLAALAGVTENLPALDGVNLLPILRDPEGATLPGDRALFWHFPGYLQANVQRGTWRTKPGGVIRLGRHKLIEYFEDGRRELYDLEEDIGEKRDLSSERPELVEKLHARLKEWREAVRAPLPTPVPGD